LYNKSVFIFSLRVLGAEILRCKVRISKFCFKKCRYYYRHRRPSVCRTDDVDSISDARSASDRLWIHVVLIATNAITSVFVTSLIVYSTCVLSPFRFVVMLL